MPWLSLLWLGFFAGAAIAVPSPTMSAYLSTSTNVQVETAPGDISDTQLERLRERVELFWNSRVEDRLDECYLTLTRRSRDEVTLMDFIRRHNIRIGSYSIAEIVIRPDDDSRAAASVLFSGSAIGYELKRVKLKQAWILENGNWYYDFRKRSNEGIFSATQRPPRDSEQVQNPEGFKVDPEMAQRAKALYEKLISASKKKPLNEQMKEWASPGGDEFAVFKQPGKAEKKEQSKPSTGSSTKKNGKKEKSDNDSSKASK